MKVVECVKDLKHLFIGFGIIGVGALIWFAAIYADSLDLIAPEFYTFAMIVGGFIMASSLLYGGFNMKL